MTKSKKQELKNLLNLARHHASAALIEVNSYYKETDVKKVLADIEAAKKALTEAGLKISNL
jgi:ABC-type transport system substrate-binding protein